jgi:hypothetical protein
MSIEAVHTIDANSANQLRLSWFCTNLQQPFGQRSEYIRPTDLLTRDSMLDVFMRR